MKSNEENALTSFRSDPSSVFAWLKDGIIFKGLTFLQGFLLISLLTRILSPHDFGIYTLIVSASYYVYIISTLNLRSGMGPFVIHLKRDSEFLRKFWLAHGASLVLMAAITPILWLLEARFHLLNLNGSLLILVVVSAFGYLLSDFATFPFQIYQKLKFYYMLNVVKGYSFLILSAIFLYFAHSQRVAILICLSLLSSLIIYKIAISQLLKIEDPSFKFDAHFLAKATLFSGGVFAIYLLSTSVPLIPRLFLSSHLDFSTLGLFSASLYFSVPLIFLKELINSFWWSYFARLSEKDRAFSAIVGIRYALTCSLGVVLLIKLSLPLLIHIVGKDYRGIENAVAILLIGHSFLVIHGIVESFYTAEAKTKHVISAWLLSVATLLSVIYGGSRLEVRPLHFLSLSVTAAYAMQFFALAFLLTATNKAKGIYAAFLKPFLPFLAAMAVLVLCPFSLILQTSAVASFVAFVLIFKVVDLNEVRG
ncbi:MAG: hypothetical protein D6808_02385, partial [Candidatus Dadabacteria bacterium]